MVRKLPVFLLFALLLIMVACGGDAVEESADGGSTAAAESEPVQAEPAAESETEEETEAAPPESEGEAAPEPTTETAPAAEEAAPAGPWGDRALSGVDPETGLAINPPAVNPGDTVIIRGEIISMNLTPTTSPEFLIQSPEGVNYRIRSQDLANTGYEDGTEIAPYQFQKGMLAQATITMAADATLADLATAEDLVLIPTE